MTDVICHSIIVIDRNTPLSFDKHESGQIELMFGTGFIAMESGAESTACLFISDPITTIPKMMEILNNAYLDVRNHQPAGEQPQ